MFMSFRFPPKTLSPRTIVSCTLSDDANAALFVTAALHQHPLPTALAPMLVCCPLRLPHALLSDQ
jgi:hypothetical protein